MAHEGPHAQYGTWGTADAEQWLAERMGSQEACM